MTSAIERAVAAVGPERFLGSLTVQEQQALAYQWRLWARPSQLPPAGEWLTWLVMSGRGFGKTRTGAEWIRQRVESGETRRIALVGRTPADARDVMVEGESGILNVFPPDQRPIYEPSKRRITFRTGAIATVYSSENPEQLRGPTHDTAWVDELGTFQSSETFDNLQLGLRMGRPRQIVTTTPRPVRTIRDLVADSDTVVTRGTSYENRANLAPAFYRQVIRRYEGTRRGQQEIMGLLLEDVPGALWQRSMIKHKPAPEMERIVVGIDPSVSDSEDAARCGIVSAGKAQDGVYYVLADRSLRASPDRWAHEAISLFHELKAERPPRQAEPPRWEELAPTLQRFYPGGDPLGWFKMTHSVIGSFATMMPKLEARESLRRAAEIAVGSGVLKPARARRIIREWQRMARTRHHRAGVKARSAEEHRTLLAGIGIPMETVPKG